MKQRKLRLDDLQIETFETSREPEGRGTVRAHQVSGACTAFCSEDVETCASMCTFSLPQERACIDTQQFGCFGTGLPEC